MEIAATPERKAAIDEGRFSKDGILIVIVDNCCPKNKDSSEKDYGTSAAVATYRANTASLKSSPPHSILRALLRCHNATARRGFCRPSYEAKRWRGYLKHNARMRTAIRPLSAASTETNEYNRNN
ncbi:hypothetical protein EVAR_92296_1 [Eumeta japonica]|uniref:Uncharacterized protein n=1 Tax=Eumeta variegata TaxID=151549 RepID=A0A4C1TMK6_EUMVA|nr:hypothetical protein EVAR_92296_1 [Eumeta japonica]